MSRMCGTTGIVPTRIDGEAEFPQGVYMPCGLFFAEKHKENHKI